MFKKSEIFWMRYCLFLSEKSKLLNEVPVGSVIILNNYLISEGWNQYITKYDVTSHAEIIAIRKASFLIKDYRLVNCSLYVTLEPCLMCFGAILNSRITNLYYGAKNKNFSTLSFLRDNFKKKVKLNIYPSLLEKECSKKLKDFFVIARFK